MSKENKAQNLAVRAHDIVVCMERTRSSDFEALSNLGNAVRLALHLRGAPIMPYSLLKEVAIHILTFGVGEVRPALELLAEAEMVRLNTEGNTIKTVVPNIPYFDDLYTTLGTLTESGGLNEVEQLTVALAERLAKSPVAREHAFSLGAETKLVQRTLDIGEQGGFLIGRRARGRDILMSPSYFPDNPDAFADLVAAKGSNVVGRVLDLLRKAQGFPLSVIESTKELGGSKLNDTELTILRTLAGGGFTAPPAIETTHAGTNFFIFGPRPGTPRLPAFKRTIYERAMALVAAVRQGQLLPAQYRIRSPYAILNKLKIQGYLKSNSEAWEQYRQVATMGIGRLIPAGHGHRLVLIDTPENQEALDMAIELVSDGNVHVSVEDDAILAFRQGHTYIEALLGRKKLVTQPITPLSEEARHAIDTMLLTVIP